MQFYFCVSVIMVSMFLFHTHTEAYQAQKVVPANPSKCSSEVTMSPHVLRDLSKVRIYECSNCDHIWKLCIYDTNYTVIKAVRLGAQFIANFPKQSAIQPTMLVVALCYVKLGDPFCYHFLANLTIYTSRDYSNTVIVHSFVF